MTKTILILAANPSNTPALRLDREVREIDNGLERARNRDEFILKQKWAPRPLDVRRAMLDFRPNIVHFCGHGSGEEGIAFEDEAGQVRLVDGDTLAEFFELFSNTVECVVLNACYSEVQAQALAKHIRHVIGMRKAIGDEAAINFAIAFYDALGAGESIEFAYKLGCNSIRWSGMSENLTPVLKTKRHKSEPDPQSEKPQLYFRLTPKFPCLLLLDVSASMNGAPIQALQAGLQSFVNDLLNDPVTLERVELAIITFGSHVAIVRDFCPILEFVVPDLSPGGSTAMGEAVKVGLDLIEMRKQEYTREGIPHYQPMILLFTDGEPTDDWHSPINRLQRESSLRRVQFFAVGLENADRGFLERISPAGKKPLMLTELRFSEMFRWLSASLSDRLVQDPKDMIDLDSPPRWSEV